MHVYIRSEPGLWTAGHYAPSGKFVPESDHETEEAAAIRVNFLNGAPHPWTVPGASAVNADLLAACQQVLKDFGDRLTGRTVIMLRAAIAKASPQGQGDV